MTLKFSFGGTTFDLVLLSPETRTSLVSARFVNRTGSSTNLERDAIIELNNFTGKLIISHKNSKIIEYPSKIHQTEIARRWSPPPSNLQSKSLKLEDRTIVDSTISKSDDFYCPHKSKTEQNPSLYKKQFQGEYIQPTPDNINSSGQVKKKLNCVKPIVQESKIDHNLLKSKKQDQDDLVQSSTLDKITNSGQVLNGVGLTVRKPKTEQNLPIPNKLGQTENVQSNPVKIISLSQGVRKLFNIAKPKVVTPGRGNSIIDSNTTTKDDFQHTKQEPIKEKITLFSKLLSQDEHRKIISPEIDNSSREVTFIDMPNDTKHGYPGNSPGRCQTIQDCTTSNISLPPDDDVQSKEPTRVQEIEIERCQANPVEDETTRSSSTSRRSPDKAGRGSKRSSSSDGIEENYRNVKFKIPRKERGI